MVDTIDDENVISIFFLYIQISANIFDWFDVVLKYFCSIFFLIFIIPYLILNWF